MPFPHRSTSGRSTRPQSATRCRSSTAPNATCAFRTAYRGSGSRTLCNRSNPACRPGRCRERIVTRRDSIPAPRRVPPSRALPPPDTRTVRIPPRQCCKASDCGWCRRPDRSQDSPFAGNSRTQRARCRRATRRLRPESREPCADASTGPATGKRSRRQATRGLPDAGSSGIDIDFASSLRVTMIRVPRPGAESTVNSPPTAAARSRMSL